MPPDVRFTKLAKCRTIKMISSDILCQERPKDKDLTAHGGNVRRARAGLYISLWNQSFTLPEKLKSRTRARKCVAAWKVRCEAPPQRQ